MILPEDTPASPSKTDSTLPATPVQREGAPSGMSPPAYNQITQPLPQASTPIFIQRAKQDPTAGKRACRRFTKAFLMAALCVTLFNMFLASVVEDGNGHPHGGHRNGQWEDTPARWQDHREWHFAGETCDPSWNDVFTHHGSEAQTAVIGWPDIPDLPDIPDIPDLPDISRDAPFSSSISFSLDAHAPNLLVVAANTWGEIIVEPKSGSDVKDSADVKVTVHYWEETARDRASVCKIETKNGGEGVGIYVPRFKGPWRKEDHVSFSVVVSLPATSIKSFETDMPIFSHQLLKLDSDFTNLILRSTNARIGVESLVAKTADIRTTNARIEGSFHTNDTLTLATSNGRIDVAVSMEDNKKAKSGKTALVMKTSNAPIVAETKLLSSNSTKGGAFSVQAKTSNAPLKLNFPSQPSKSTLELDSSTSNAGATVVLNPAFEGSFKTSTSSYMGTPTLHQYTDKDDPEKKHRKRNVVITRKGKGFLEGVASWEVWTEGKGIAEVRTSNAKVDLTV